MPQIKLTNVTKRWGKFYGVDRLNLLIDDNAFVTLLGPSGCGKTTTLRMIAGLETPTSGRIEIGDRVVYDSELGINVPPNKRKVGFLFQNYALWPNMTVYKNIAFGLSNIKEELPVYNWELKINSKIYEILQNPSKIISVIDECKDKNEKIDEEKVLMKLIDTFEISMFTAKKIFAYSFHKQPDYQARAKEISAKLKEKNDSIVSQSKNDGISFSKDFQILQAEKPLVKERKLTDEEIDLAVRKVSRVVKIGMFMDRYPAELSGGQQQRVAIARTLAPEPSVLFMDEPLSNLDAKLRLEMRYELQRLHIETGSTFVYVTHDQMEAMTLATKICLINNGVLQQYEPPLTVYNRPNNLFVADFVGNPSINFIDAQGEQIANGELKLKIFDDFEVSFVPESGFNLDSWYKDRDLQIHNKEENEKLYSLEHGYVEKANKDEVFKYPVAKISDEQGFAEKEESLPKNGDFVLGVRPEFLQIAENGMFNAEICGAMPTGLESTIKLKVKDFLLTSVVFGGVTFEIGSTHGINFASNNILLFDRKTGRRITSGSIKA
ncbi:ABC transporter ATP-binding protein [Treponema zioleckii]|uniref:ABC transporter ATP-binding protein n=1 Tax=Treponema zioleckii TaxID=331680 RepID=UPI00168ACD53|nr:ABC transporter ATP-binding protein [Treponema zioleckii]